MRYVMVSDIHGQFDKLIDALDRVDFNPEEDTLVSLGDPFDRGPQSFEVLLFLMSCPNRILIWGNHDLRLKELVNGTYEQAYDYTNGVLKTVQSLCKNKNIASIGFGLNILRTDSRYKDAYDLLWQYFNECIFAAEWKDLIATHGWLPGERWVEKKGNDWEPIYILYDNWRNASWSEWVDATWGNTERAVKSGAFPDKHIVVGHWHAWRLRYRNTYRSQLPDTIDFSTYAEQNFTAIDGCSNAKGGLVNAFVYESDEAPQLFDGKAC